MKIKENKRKNEQTICIIKKLKKTVDKAFALW